MGLFGKKRELKAIRKLNYAITPITRGEMQEHINLGEYTKIDMSNHLAHINAVQQLIPTFGTYAANGVKDLSSLGTLFRFVAPEGLEGIQPMQYRNGLMSSITRNGNQFGQHGGYEIVDLSNGVSQLSPINIAFATFSALSFITGQYFMKQNNDKLKEIKEGISEIKAHLDNAMLSEIEAIYNFLRDAVNHQNDNNELLHQAYLNNIVASKVKLDKYMAMTRNEIERLIQIIANKGKNDDVSKNCDTYVRLANRYQLLADCYMVACVLEVSYSGYYKSSFIERQREDVELKVKGCRDVIDSSYSKVEEYYQSVKGTQYSLIDQIFKGIWSKELYMSNKKEHIESNLGKVKESINTEEYNQNLLNYVEVLSILDKIHNSSLDMIVDNECIYLRV